MKFMSDMKFQLNSAGVSALLRSSEMQGILREKGQGIASRAGANAKISTTDIKSMARNKKHNILLKAMR